jgi:hypothetical protein
MDGSDSLIHGLRGPGEWRAAAQGKGESERTVSFRTAFALGTFLDTTAPGGRFMPEYDSASH